MGHEDRRRSLVILLADDNRSDRRLVEEALKESGQPHELHSVEDGDSVLAFLRGEGEHAGAPRPDLVLLDLRMPGLDGGEVLEAMYRDSALHGIAVVVQSSSDSDIDLVKAFELGALRYVTKPVNAEKLAPVLRGAANGHIEW